MPTGALWVLKGSKTGNFIMKSYFYKSLMTSWGKFSNQKNPSLQLEKKD
jgi:hypothetical protein